VIDKKQKLAKVNNDLAYIKHKGLMYKWTRFSRLDYRKSEWYINALLG